MYFVEIVFSTIFALIFTFGHLLSVYENLEVQEFDILIVYGYLLGFIVIWVILLLFFLFLKKRTLQRTKKTRNKIAFSSLSDGKFGFVVFLAIFLCYVPIILSGVSMLSPDSWSSISQILGNSELTSSHPIIFTFFAGIFVRLGLIISDLSFGLLLYSIAQSIALAAIFSRCMIWIRKQRASRAWIVAAFIFFALLPVNSVAGIIFWKDILFAGFGLMIIIYLHAFFSDKNSFNSKSKVIYFITFAFLFSAWRINGFYAYLLMVTVILLIDRFKYLNLKRLSVFVFPIILFLLYSYAAAFIAKPSQGVLVVAPLQQIARTVTYHQQTLTSDELSKINQILPVEKIPAVYNPELSDPIVNIFNKREFENNKSSYASLWVSLSNKYSKTYIASFLYNTYGYVYPFDESPSPTDILMDNDIHRNTVDGYTDKAYDNNSKKALIAYRNLVTSVIPIIQNIGFYFSIVLMTLYIAIIKKMRELTAIYILLFSLFLSTILGPVNGEFRYLYLFVVSAPFLLTAVLNKINYLPKEKKSVE